MKILHIFNDGPTELSQKIISVQALEHEIKVIELYGKEISYESIVDDIFLYDRVISW